MQQVDHKVKARKADIHAFPERMRPWMVNGWKDSESGTPASSDEMSHGEYPSWS